MGVGEESSLKIQVHHVLYEYCRIFDRIFADASDGVSRVTRVEMITVMIHDESLSGLFTSVIVNLISNGCFPDSKAPYLIHLGRCSNFFPRICPTRLAIIAAASEKTVAA